ncbi:hypothetical protein [Shewanella sp. Isolate11]|uniref:hypothetical protein n=1 Tax=Shewanella sp. Isolate11 TaxID=2908530 RepID=UPI001EFCBBD0|nr:hypothetical protein [Shewanella sp. Isolate11]MCG9697709.1 hypothetical protein [Shewanella sp. Isolate11]
MNIKTRDLPSWYSRKCKSVMIACSAIILSLTHFSSSAAQIERQNLVQLIESSEQIVAGVITNVTDGFDANNLPYTEVTMSVGRKIKGKKNGKKFDDQQGETITFKQFGLIKPRKLSNGKTLLMTTPQGWSTYGKGERVMLFLHKPASMTGLQTTAGLSQGKLSYVNGQLTNSYENKGLFEKLSVSAANLTPEQQAMIAGTSAKFNSQALTQLVERAVAEGWIENGVMRNEK